MDTSTSTPSSARIMQLGMGFGPAKVLLSALELGLFATLSGKTMTGADARRTNAFGLMMSLNMLIEFGDAFDFTAADFFGWCREVGFQNFDVIPLGGPASAGVAYK